MLEPLLLQYFLFCSKINSVVFKSLVTLKRNWEQVTGTVLLPLQRACSKCSTSRELTALTCSCSWSFYRGSGCLLLTISITSNVILQVRPQISEYSIREVSIDGALTAGMRPFKDTLPLGNAAASVSCRHVLQPRSACWGCLLCSWAPDWVLSRCKPLWKRRAEWEQTLPFSALSSSIYLKKLLYNSSCVSNTAEFAHFTKIAGDMHLHIQAIEFNLWEAPGSCLPSVFWCALPYGRTQKHSYSL